MRINTEGLIVSEQTVSEADKLITILTKDEGIVRAFVRSARNIKNKNSVATQLLSYSSFILYKGKDKYIVNEADVKELFFGLRADIEKLALAQYFCEIAIALAPHQEECTDFLRLILNALYYLVNDKLSPRILKSIVEIRATSLAGFMPDLVCCRRCGEYESDVMHLILNDGKIICTRCFKDMHNSAAVALDRGATAAFRHIIYSELKRIFSFTLENKSSEILSNASERYLCAHAVRRFKTLDFYHALSQ